MSVTDLSSPEVSAQKVRHEFDDAIYGQMLLVDFLDKRKINVPNLRRAMGAKFRKSLVARERALLELLGQSVPDDDELAARVEHALDRIAARILEPDEEDD